MDQMPWNYWTSEAKPREGTEEVLRLLESVLASNPEHVGANHYYIHAVEEYFPEKAEAAADRLGGIAPDAGHLVHMPSHIYWRVGRYNDALEINQRASAADEQFFARCRAGAFYRAAYYPHNVHFLWAAAAAEGQSEVALTAARKLAAKTQPLLAELPFVEEFISTPVLTLARFGRWDAVLGEPRPAEGHPYLLGTWHYARGLAYVRGGKLGEADRELAAVQKLQASPEAEALLLAGGTSTAANLLAIGADHLAGEIAATRGDTEVALTRLRAATERQDALAYMEPPPFYFPTRQALGAVLLSSGKAAEAEAAYQLDLQQYPANGWSLFGLAQSLRALERNDEAALVERGFNEAWARADVKLESSRF